MKTAIGTKVIRFEPMTQKEFGEKFKPNTGDVTLQDIDGYHVQYDNPDGSVYDSWSPKDVFEAAYTDTESGVSFEHAVWLMKRGYTSLFENPKGNEPIRCTMKSRKVEGVMDNYWEFYADGKLCGNFNSCDVSFNNWKVINA